MVNDLVYRYLEHPHRLWITWGMAGFIALIFALPAWDESLAARDEVASLNSELRNTTHAVSNLELMKVKLRDVESHPDAVHTMIDLERADRIREQVTRLAHEMNCQMRRLTLSDPLTRSWGEDDDPFETSAPENADKSNCELETRKLNVSVDGNLSQLSKLTIALTQLDRFAVPTEMTLHRERENGQLRLDVDISLFNLVETHD